MPFYLRCPTTSVLHILLAVILRCCPNQKKCTSTNDQQRRASRTIHVPRRTGPFDLRRTKLNECLPQSTPTFADNWYLPRRKSLGLLRCTISLRIRNHNAPRGQPTFSSFLNIAPFGVASYQSPLVRRTSKELTSGAWFSSWKRVNRVGFIKIQHANFMTLLSASAIFSSVFLASVSA